MGTTKLFQTSSSLEKISSSYIMMFTNNHGILPRSKRNLLRSSLPFRGFSLSAVMKTTLVLLLFAVPAVQAARCEGCGKKLAYLQTVFPANPYIKLVPTETRSGIKYYCYDDGLRSDQHTEATST